MSAPAQDRRLTRRNMMIGGAMLATAGLAWAREPRVNAPILGDAKLDDVIPKRIGGWSYETASGLVLPPPDQMRDEIYSDLLTRVYRSGDGQQAIMLLVAYSGAQDGVLQVHRPEVCYPASGFTLTTTQERPFEVAGRTLPTRFLVADAGGRTEQLIYWTRIGPSFPTSWASQRIAVIEENLKGSIPDGVLVRVSTNAPDAESGLEAIDRFTREMVAALPPRGRAVMLG